MFVFAQRKIHTRHNCPWSRVFIRADDVGRVLKSLLNHVQIQTMCFISFSFFEVKDIL